MIEVIKSRNTIVLTTSPLRMFGRRPLLRDYDAILIGSVKEGGEVKCHLFCFGLFPNDPPKSYEVPLPLGEGSLPATRLNFP